MGDVLVRTDNRTAIAYINMPLLSLKVFHIPGLENRWADLMSRDSLLPDEWRLHPEVIKNKNNKNKNMFTNRHNTQCPLWFSLMLQDEPPQGVDMFAHVPWPEKLLYAFPSLWLIPFPLERVRQEQLAVILIVPGHHLALWYAEIIQMLVARP